MRDEFRRELLSDGDKMWENYEHQKPVGKQWHNVPANNCMGYQKKAHIQGVDYLLYFFFFPFRTHLDYQIFSFSYTANTGNESGGTLEKG